MTLPSLKPAPEMQDRGSLSYLGCAAACAFSVAVWSCAVALITWWVTR